MLCTKTSNIKKKRKYTQTSVPSSFLRLTTQKQNQVRPTLAIYTTPTLTAKSPQSFCAVCPASTDALLRPERGSACFFSESHVIKGQRAATGGYNPTDCNKRWEKERINGTHRSARTRGFSQVLTIKTSGKLGGVCIC